MTTPACCPTAIAAQAVAIKDLDAQSTLTPADVGPVSDPSHFIQENAEGYATLHLMVENVHCAGCIRTVESTMLADPGVVSARLNLSTRRLVLSWRIGEVDPQVLMRRLATLGYPSAPYDPVRLADAGADEDRRLLHAVAVSGFAAANVMLLSVSVWAGHFGDMTEVTRTFFHWISAIIALPAIAYAGRPFFTSAIQALKSRIMNMDVPISLAVLLASGMSVFQTAQHAEHAYFDAAVTLLFFLLIGRYLDRRARAKARDAAEHLMALSALSATVIGPDGTRRSLPVSAVEPGMMVAVMPGDRVPVDGVIDYGRSDMDTQLVTGETTPESVAPGDRVFAGTINLSGPLKVRVAAASEDTLLAEIVRLMESAEQGRARYVRLADKIARIYSPVVHIVAGVTFIGWMYTGAAWDTSLMVAVAVLIITCPCALGLAVPAVQVVASGALLRRGVLLKSADGLERLAQIDTIVFDKTGTLTTGEPVLSNSDDISDDDLALAAAVCRDSRHPLARAVVSAAKIRGLTSGEMDVQWAEEYPGQGIGAMISGLRVRIGNAKWCSVKRPGDAELPGPEFWMQRAVADPIRFSFIDRLRLDAQETVQTLKQQGYNILLLSGDRSEVVEAMAKALEIEEWQASCLPAEKVAVLDALRESGCKVLMVGDGLNDAPALAAGFASMSPSTASDVSRTTADAVFQGGKLARVTDTLRIAKRADRMVKQNFGMALGYNLIAIPLAVMGFATPLIAAIAMSSSSLVVTLNALRLRLSVR